MGKQPPKADQNGKMKVRIIEFELEGSDMSLQESLKRSLPLFPDRQLSPLRDCSNASARQEALLRS
jgi:hypothetical protein